jgi:FixJ family two-component response regulator
MTKDEPTVFIIDDDASVRKGLSRLLRSLGFDVEAFASAEEFLVRERFQGVGCIVLDVRMPGLSGVDLQNELTRVHYDVPIIFITGHGDIPMSVEAMKKGAIDFLPKPFDEDALLLAVTRALEKAGDARVLKVERDALKSRLELLTPRETEILRYVISGMLNKQIAYELDIAEKTVKVHRGRIMEKLSVNSVADLVRLAERVGIEPHDREAR